MSQVNVQPSEWGEICKQQHSMHFACSLVQLTKRMVDCAVILWYGVGLSDRATTFLSNYANNLHQLPSREIIHMWKNMLEKWESWRNSARKIPCFGYLINNQKLIVGLVRFCAVGVMQLHIGDKWSTNMIQSIVFQVEMIILLTVIKIMMTRLCAYYADAWRNVR